MTYPDLTARSDRQIRSLHQIAFSVHHIMYLYQIARSDPLVCFPDQINKVDTQIRPTKQIPRSNQHIGYLDQINVPHALSPASITASEHDVLWRPAPPSPVVRGHHNICRPEVPPAQTLQLQPRPPQHRGQVPIPPAPPQLMVLFRVLFQQLIYHPPVPQPVLYHDHLPPRPQHTFYLLHHRLRMLKRAQTERVYHGIERPWGELPQVLHSAQGLRFRPRNVVLNLGCQGPCLGGLRGCHWVHRGGLRDER